MLGDAPVFPTLPCVNLEAARKFYSETLGLDEVELPGMGEEVAESSALFQCGQGTMLFVYLRSEPPKAENTAANWLVSDVDAVADELINRGIKLETYDLPGIEYDARGVGTMGETKGAWFKDPDGNILGFTQAP
jgi:catechol 2,3-dioxygenase-like lactoylglutathione lyase family enzyme